MFEKRFEKFRDSVVKTISDFFGKDVTVGKAVDIVDELSDRYESKYHNLDTVPFSSVESKDREDIAKYKTLRYFLNVLVKLDELGRVIKGEPNDNTAI